MPEHSNVDCRMCINSTHFLSAANTLLLNVRRRRETSNSLYPHSAKGDIPRNILDCTGRDTLPACYNHIHQLRCIRPYLNLSTACTTATPSFTSNVIAIILSAIKATGQNAPKPKRFFKMSTEQNALIQSH